MSQSIILTAALAIGVLLIARMAARGRTHDGDFSVLAALGFESSDMESEVDLDRLWIRASEEESPVSIVHRAFAMCGNWALKSELVTLIRHHPRYHADPKFRSNLEAIIDAHSTSVTGDYHQPLCILFRKGNQAPEWTTL